MIMKHSKILMKSSGYSNSAITIDQATVGTQSINLNWRYVSINSAIILGYGNCTTKKIDLLDVTSGSACAIMIGIIFFSSFN